MTDEEYQLEIVKHFGIAGIFGDRKGWENHLAECGFGC